MANFNKVRLNGLTIKYLLGTLTEQEQHELDAILDQDPTLRQRFEQRVDRGRLKQQLETYMTAQQRMAIAQQQMSIPGQPATPIDHPASSELHPAGSAASTGQSGISTLHPASTAGAPADPSGQLAKLHPLRRYLPYAAAAAILLVVTGLAIWLSLRKAPKKQLNDPIIAMQYEVQPGANRATLTLANGTTIDLDSAGKGTISRQGNVSVVKTDDGQLKYAAEKGAATAATWNRISTPRGGTWLVTLPDGSRAWLNAASSIRFPSSFDANRREAEITGEVYFDIAHDPSRPFYVASGSASVQVLGTEFDIRHYANDSTQKITLVNGSVRVQSGQQQKNLIPGQQALLTSEALLSLIDHPDIDQATAWKNGFFKFKDADIRSIMREVERWYDVDVVYEISDYSNTYGGRISRALPLSQLLRLLQGNNIHHYKMEGRKLIVLP